MEIDVPPEARLALNREADQLLEACGSLLNTQATPAENALFINGIPYFCRFDVGKQARPPMPLSCRRGPY